MTRGFRVRVEGLDEIIRAFRDLPGDAQRELDQTTRELSQLLAQLAAAAGRADSRQSARAAGTVRAAGGSSPGVEVGPHPLLFGSEFGATARFGWYRRGRYHASPARQFRPHLGGGSYWFFRTVEEHEADIDSAWAQAADAIIRSWSG